MLRRIGLDAPTAPGSREFGAPLIRWRLEPSVSGSTVYWRLAEPDRCLLEIGVDSAVGRLRGVTLVFFCGRVGALGTFREQPVERGTPRFDVSPWETRAQSHRGIFAIDEDRGCELERGGDEVRIRLLDGEPVKGVLTEPGMMLEFTRFEDLLAIRFLGLSESEMIDFRRGVGGNGEPDG